MSKQVLLVLALLGIAAWVGCSNLEQSGPLWPDEPQYANAGALVHDWLLSGELLHPWEFAQKNYIQYPAFHLPYHPPVYPGLLGLFFLVFGVSYTAARVFTVLCLWGSGCCFWGILRRLGAGKNAASWATVAFVTLPEVAYWSRSAMSELPGLLLILAGTYCFLTWLERESSKWYLAAFAFAQLAFLARYLTAGILPAWLIWTLLTGKFRKLLTPLGIIAPALFLAISTGWTRFSRQYSTFETNSGPQGSVNYAPPFSWEVFKFYTSSLPHMLGWLLLVLSVAGFIYGVVQGKSALQRYAGLAWLAFYAAFILMLGIHDEPRYFIYALPVFPAALINLFPRDETGPGRAYIPTVLVLGVLGSNLFLTSRLPTGSIGHAAIAQQLATLHERGNILIDLPLQTQVIFEYRARAVPPGRSFIRMDRTLGVRGPGYSKAPDKVLAESTADVLSIIQKGRIRYVVATDTPWRSDAERPERRLLLGMIRDNPQLFLEVGKFPLKIEDQFGVDHLVVHVWSYREELPSGPSELPVLIPTANLTLLPSM